MPPTWRYAWYLKERASRNVAVKTVEKLAKHSGAREDAIIVQNHTGNYPEKWYRTSVVVDCSSHDQYTVKIMQQEN